MNEETIYVNGALSNRRARIVITSPKPGDKEYAENTVKIWNKDTAFPLKGNMKIELLDDEIGEIIIERNNFYIKITDPSPGDVKYIRMLITNWKNYYKPENYLLPNAKIIKDMYDC